MVLGLGPREYKSPVKEKSNGEKEKKKSSKDDKEKKEKKDKDKDEKKEKKHKDKDKVRHTECLKKLLGRKPPCQMEVGYR